MGSPRLLTEVQKVWVIASFFGCLRTFRLHHSWLLSEVFGQSERFCPLPTGFFDIGLGMSAPRRTGRFRTSAGRCGSTWVSGSVD